MARYPGDTNLNDREKRMAAELEAARMERDAERKKREAAELRARELASRLKKQ